MTTAAAGPRETFLRERFARSINSTLRVFDPRLIYVTFVLTGLGTGGLLLAHSPASTAAIFVAYVLALTAFLVLERRRITRALKNLEAILSEVGPPPERNSTLGLPRFLLTVDDAIDQQMLDSILQVDGDSLDELRITGRALFKAMKYFQRGSIWMIVMLLAAAISLLSVIFDRSEFQLHLAEVTLAVLALVPAYVASRDQMEYTWLARRLNLRRADDAEDALRRMPVEGRPFIDGHVIRYRNNAYVVERRALRPRIDAKSVARTRRLSAQIDLEIWFGLAVSLSTVAFLLHPISGILVQ